MDEALRVRVMNTVLLTGILLLYVVYDTGFRFWMARSDAITLDATILHDPIALKTYGESGLAFEAAAEVTTTPALQTYFYKSYSWSRLSVSSTTVKEPLTETNNDEKKNGKIIIAEDKANEAVSEKLSATAPSDFPMAAVVVESTWLSPDHASVSAAYAQRLIEGFRYALLTGAPWLLLAGSSEEASLGLQHLRRLMNPAETLFGQASVARWPAALAHVAAALRASMLPYETLGAWMHGASSKPIPTFATASLPSLAASTSWEHSLFGDNGGASAALRFSLNHLLSVSALGGAEGDSTALKHGQPSSLFLGAAWLQRSDAAFLRSVNGGGVESFAAGLEGGAAEPHITLYDTEDEEYRSDTTPDRSGNNVNSNAWELPRVCEFYLNGTQQRVHVIVPGVVAVVVPDPNKRARYAAAAVQQLLERTLAQRHAQHIGASTSNAHNEMQNQVWWWWLGRTYGVTVVGGGWEQQRIKLLYLKALREAADDTRENLRKAVLEVHRARCQFEGSGSGGAAAATASSSSSLLCRGARAAQLPSSALPFFTTGARSPPKVFVLPPAFEEAPLTEPQPAWLNYTGELPPSISPDASYPARVIGRWSFYLYANYRRWMDWFLASLPGGAYQDHFVLASVLMSDLADHRISWRDVFYIS